MRPWLLNTSLNHFHQLGSSVQGPPLKGFRVWHLAGYRRTLSLNSLWDILESVSVQYHLKMHICLYRSLADTDAHVHIFIDENTHYTDTHTHTYVRMLEQPKLKNGQAVIAGAEAEPVCLSTCPEPGPAVRTQLPLQPWNMASDGQTTLGLNACWLCELQLAGTSRASVSMLVQRQGDWYLEECSREDAGIRQAQGSSAECLHRGSI